tara:strand:- start:407 stop:1018 length:612 start_codon:yes stop_codon:yes gene_type:complete
MKIIAIGASNSINSINKRLANYAASLFENSSIEQIDLNTYEVEIYSVEKEAKNGMPSKIEALANKIDKVDLLVISLSEQNGSYSAAFKNIYDWLSRIPNRKVLGEKPVLLMTTSPGGRDGTSVVAAGIDRFPRDGSEVLESFSLPSFQDNFDNDEISNISFRVELIRKVNTIKSNRFNHFYKDDSFTCGIDPTKDDCGDAIEY